MEIFLNIVFLVLGFLITTFSLSNILLMLICGFSCENVLIKSGIAQDKAAKALRARDIRAFFIQAFVFLISLLVTIFLFDEYLAAFLIGLGVSCFFGMKSYTLSPSTISDYTEGAIRYLTNRGYSIKPKYSNSVPLTEKQKTIFLVIYDILPNLIENQASTKQPSDDFSYTDEQIQSITSSYNSAFLIIKDYNNGLIIPSTLTGNDVLYRYIVNSFYICLGWCVFHASTAKRQMVFCEIDRFVDGLEATAPENLQSMTSALKVTYRSMSEIMLRYKKNNIDPSYLQDNSKENYNKLITEFLEYVCKISKIQWYDGIVEDFKHCMDE